VVDGSNNLLANRYVSSVEKNGTGDFTIHFLEYFPKDYYGISCSIHSTNILNINYIIKDRTKSYCRILFFGGSTQILGITVSQAVPTDPPDGFCFTGIY